MILISTRLLLLGEELLTLRIKSPIFNMQKYLIHALFVKFIWDSIKDLELWRKRFMIQFKI